MMTTSRLAGRSPHFVVDRLTQAQAGDLAGIRNTHVSSVERGERGLSYRTLLALLRAYDVGLRGLVEEIERGGVG